MTDEEVIHKAYTEKWIIITADKDFGEKVYREKHPHCGIVLLRLEDERSAQKIKTLEQLLENYAQQLADHFVVATETRVRFAKVRK